MMRKGISDVDSVLTVRELARLIRLYGIDTSNVEHEPADEPLSREKLSGNTGRSIGRLAEGIVTVIPFSKNEKGT